MDSLKQNLLKSFRAIIVFFDERKDEITPVSQVISDKIDNLKETIEDIDRIAVLAERETQELTEKKAEIKVSLVAYCLQVNNCLRLYIKKILKDDTLLTKVPFTKSDLNTTDEMLPVRARAILEVADIYIPLAPEPTPEDPNPTPLPNPVKPFGATPQLVKELRDTLSSFELKSPEARKIEQHVKGANEDLDTKFQIGKDDVAELEDMFVAAFLTNDNNLYKAWETVSTPDKVKTKRIRITGTITDEATGLIVKNVKVINKASGKYVKSKKDGTYSLVVPATGIYTIEYNRKDYLLKQEQVPIGEAGETVRDIKLTPVISQTPTA